MLLPDLPDRGPELLDLGPEVLVPLVEEHQAGHEGCDGCHDDADDVGLHRRIQTLLSECRRSQPGAYLLEDRECTVRGDGYANAGGERQDEVLVLLDPRERRGERFSHPIHRRGYGRLDPVDELFETSDYGCLEVPRGALDRLCRACGSLRCLGRPEREDSSIELLGADLTLLQGLTEVPGVGARLKQRLLNLPRCTRNRVRELVEVLSRQLPLTGGLGKNHPHGLERLRIPPGNGVQVPRSLRKTVETLNTIRGELRSNALNIRKVVNRRVRVILRGLRETRNRGVINTRELQRGDELICRIRRGDRLRGETTNTDRGREREQRPDRGPDEARH